MAEFEKKVLKGLECCGNGNMCGGHCPYDGPDDGIEGCTSQLARDALSLLKAQNEVIEDLRKVGYPHNFQREEPWIVDYMRLITGVIKKAVELN